MSANIRRHIQTCYASVEMIWLWNTLINMPLMQTAHPQRLLLMPNATHRSLKVCKSWVLWCVWIRQLRKIWPANKLKISATFTVTRNNKLAFEKIAFPFTVLVFFLNKRNFKLQLRTEFALTILQKKKKNNKKQL